MPLSTPKPKEDKDTFLSRCIRDTTMQSEFPDGKQRFVVCLQQWETKQIVYIYRQSYFHCDYIFFIVEFFSN